MSEIKSSVKMTIPFVNFTKRYANDRDEILKAVDEVFSSGSYILGQYVEEFEKAIANYLSCKHVLGVANGTDAIILCLKAFNIGPGDEVIMPVNSFIASGGAVAAVGATPVFCDITDDLNIDTNQLAGLITNNTKAILPVHLTGKPASMQPIMDIAKEFNLKVIEDAAQSIGASYKNNKAGTIGNAGCFSLHPLKNLFVYGDGGLITTNDTELYNKLLLLRNHGLKDRDTCECWGLNSRLDSIQAKLGVIGLNHLEEWTKIRRSNAKQYQEGLSNIVTTPNDQEECFSVYHNFVIQTPKRDALMAFLSSHNIESKVHYPVPMHLQPAAKSLGYKKGDFPVAERMQQEMLSLPIHTDLTTGEIAYIIDKIILFFKEKS